MPVLKKSTEQVRRGPRTEGDRVFIPIIHPVTGKPIGKDAVVSLADGDLAAAGPWYTNGQLVYTIVRRLGTPIRLSLDAVLVTRQTGGCIDASQVIEDPHATGARKEVTDDTQTD